MRAFVVCAVWGAFLFTPTKQTKEEELDPVFADDPMCAVDLLATLRGFLVALWNANRRCVLAVLCGAVCSLLHQGFRGHAGLVRPH